MTYLYDVTIIHVVTIGSALYRAMLTLLEDDTRLLNTNASVAIHKMAESACQWISLHPDESKAMEKYSHFNATEMHAKVKKLQAASADVVALISSSAFHLSMQVPGTAFYAVLRMCTLQHLAQWFTSMLEISCSRKL